MKIETWHQNVLVASADSAFHEVVKKAFGPETNLSVCRTSVEAVGRIENEKWNVVVVDLASIDPADKWYGENNSISFYEIAQLTNQLHPGAMIIMAVNKLKIKDAEFAKKCGASLIMDRKVISLNLMVFVIRVLRRRTFRTVLMSDLREDKKYPASLYHFLSLNRRYGLYLPEGGAFTKVKAEKAASLRVRHLYAREEELPALFEALRSDGRISRTEQMSLIRAQYRSLIISLFDCSSDGHSDVGHVLLKNGMAIVQALKDLCERYPTPQSCLDDLPYPRWSTIAHGINCAIYALVFGKYINLPSLHDVAFAGLVHNLGEAELDQAPLDTESGEVSLGGRVSPEYQTHVTKSLERLRQKRIAVSPMIEQTILFHHENHDGTGYPKHLAGEEIPVQAMLMHAIDVLDSIASSSLGRPGRSAREAWQTMTRNATLRRQIAPGLVASLDRFWTSP